LIIYQTKISKGEFFPTHKDSS